MKLQNELSIKSALRFALPCIVSALLFTACSNDGVKSTPGGSDSVTSGTVRFTASAPTSDAVTTRIGIDDANKPSVTDYLVDEPVIWLADDRVSVFFVKEGSAPIHAEFKVDGTTLSDDKKSADLVNITDLSGLDGTYTIYAFTPYKSTNTLESISLDLSSQTQAATHNNYSHLGGAASMRAAGVGATFTNGSTSNNVNFAFEHITSFLRFNITNSLGTGNNINVTGINLSHPKLFTSATYDVKTGILTAGPDNSEITLSIDGGKFLQNNEDFDVYFSTFPISTNYTSTDELSFSISYGGGDAPVAHSILSADLLNIDAVELFPTGSRFLFEVQVPGSNNNDAAFDPDVSAVCNGFIYSIAALNPSLQPDYTFDGLMYFDADNLPDACASGWELVTRAIVTADDFDFESFWYAVEPFALGVYRLQGDYIYATNGLFLKSENRASVCHNYWGVFTNTSVVGYGLKALCRRAI